MGAGLGITVRTRAGLPAHLRPIEGLPGLPTIGLSLHQADSDPAPPVAQLGAILLAELEDVALHAAGNRA